jgi:hypothetical protein
MPWTDAEKLQAIEARMNGEWDDPALVKLGPLSPSMSNDIERIINGKEFDPATAAQEGRNAYLRQRSALPDIKDSSGNRTYPSGSPSWHAWWDGWNAARQEER